MFQGIVWRSWSGRFDYSRNEWNWTNTCNSCFHRLCPLKSIDENFKNNFQNFSSVWISLVPKHSLLKYFILKFARHKSSRFKGSGPPKTQPCLKGGPEPCENEIHEILGSELEDRCSGPFFDLVQNTSLVLLSYLLHICNFVKAPRDMAKFPQKCQKIAGG